MAKLERSEIESRWIDDLLRVEERARRRARQEFRMQALDLLCDLPREAVRALRDTFLRAIGR